MLRLALAMRTPVGVLLDSITSAELTEWLAFYGLEPWGCEREDYRAGVVAATTANMWLKKDQAVSPLDFFPRPDGDQQRRANNAIDLRELAPHEIQEIARAMVGSLTEGGVTGNG